MYETNFGLLDWGVVAAYLLGSLVIGLYVRKYVSNMTDFVVAGRGVRTALGVATMTGTEMGLITVMYSAQKGFVGGFAAFHIAVVAAVVTFLVGATGFIVCRLRELKVLTIPEFYELRFGRKTRILGGVMLALGGILNMGLFLKVGSMFIVGITGMEEGAALAGVMVILLLLVLVYTVLGGMISVIVTDYVQFVVLAFGLLLTCGLAVQMLGWENIFRTVIAHKGEAGFNPLLEGTFGIEYVVWMCFLGLISCAVWQTAVIRALAAESAAVVKKQYMWSSVSFLIRFLVPYFWGICAFVFVMQTPELKEMFFPAGEGAQATDNLYAMPLFLGKLLPTGLIGLVTAAMLAAFMSTHDSYLLCWSSVITQDIIAPLKGSMATKGRIRLTRALIVVIGLYILYWGLVYSGTEDVWDYMAVSGAIYFTGAFSLLAFGLYWKRASSTGAVMALCSGLSAILGLGPVQKALGFSLSSAWVGLGTVGLSLCAMAAGSVLFPDGPGSGESSGGEG
jgi:SSS family solute:Na+ symporter